MLAEVSDKIRGLHLVAATVVLALTLLSRPRAALVVLLPVTVAWAALFSYVALEDDPLRGVVVAEVGAAYGVQQVVAAVLPAAALALVSTLRHPRRPGGAGSEVGAVSGSTE